VLQTLTNLQAGRARFTVDKNFLHDELLIGKGAPL